MATLPPSYTLQATIDAMTAAAAAGGGSDYKALVCVFLFGANDAHNTVMPRSAGGASAKAIANRNAYNAARADMTNVGIAEATTPVHSLDSDLRLHPNLVNLFTRWGANKLGILMNVGTLAEPITRAEFIAQSKDVPRSLFSHNSQQECWQTTPLVEAGSFYHGWFGRAAELAGPYFNPSAYQSLPMAFSWNGTSKQPQGYITRPNAAVKAGDTASGFTVATAYTAIGSSTVVSGGYFGPHKTQHGWQNVYQEELSAAMSNGITNQNNLANPGGSPLPALSATPLGRFLGLTDSLSLQLQAVARVIENRAAYGQRRQLFFVSLGGFDDHQNLRAGHDPRMTVVDAALNAFWLAVNDMSLANNVVTFTESDFGRALVANGSRGVDHGWGGHHFIMGGAVVGGIYGTKPSIVVDGVDDSGKGRLIPTTSVEQYAATLLKWWGIPTAQLPIVLPNLPTFSPTTISGVLP